MENLRASTKGQEELQSRLKKLHEEKELIVNLLDHLIGRMDIMVNHVTGLSNINQFLMRFIRATSTMEQTFLKLFKIHVLLTEDSYVDTEHGDPPMAITYSIQDSNHNAGSELTVVAENSGYHCLQPSSMPEVSPFHSSSSVINSTRAVSPSLEAFSPFFELESTSPGHNAINLPRVPNPAKVPSKCLSASSLPTLLANGQDSSTSAETVASTRTGASGDRERDLAPVSKLTYHSPNTTSTAKKPPVLDPSTTSDAVREDSCLNPSNGATCSSGEESGISKWSTSPQGAIPKSRNDVKFPQTSPKYLAMSGQSKESLAKSAFPQENPPVVSTAALPPAFSNTTTAVVETPTNLNIPLPTVEITRRMEDVVLSFYKTPSEFWLQFESSADTLESLLHSLHDHYEGSNADPEFIARVGMFCVAYYAEDGHWYRAKVQQVMPDHAKVFYVDFGNSDRVDLQSLRPLDTHFASLPAQAICCSIKGVKYPFNQNMWTMAAVRTFRDRISSCSKLRAIFIEKNMIQDRYIVEVLAVNEHHGMINLSQQFISSCNEGTTSTSVGAAAVKPAPAAGVPLSPKPKAVVLPPVPPEGDTFQLILSVIFNPSEFYGHLTTGNSDHGLEELQEQLNQLGMQASAPAAEEVTEGTFWACPYGPDRSWYRVRVVEVLQGVSPKRCKVFYVDYGNRSTVPVSDLRPLTTEVCRSPAHAHRLALAFVGPRQGPKWDDIAKQLFVSQTGFDRTLSADKKRQWKEGVDTVLEVVLWDKENPRVAININVWLVEQNVAAFKQEDDDLSGC